MKNKNSKKQIKKLARRISKILNDSHLPVELYNAFTSALNDYQTEQIDNSVLKKIENSGNYIAKILIQSKEVQDEQ